MVRYCRLWEEGGKYYLSDQYDLNRVVFNSAEERQKWMDDFEPETGKKLIVLPLGKIEDRSVENLRRELKTLDELIAGD